MNEEKKSYSLPHVPGSALINIEVSGVFLRRCQTLLISLGEEIGKDNLKEMYSRFKNESENPKDNIESTLYILTALVSEIERKAIEQKKVIQVEVTSEELAKMFPS